MPSRVHGPELALVYERHWSAFARRAGPALGRMLHALGVPAGRVVDLGCGVGHVALALTRRGYRVLGIDSSRAVVALARRRAPAASYRVARMETARLPPKVEAVVSTFDALNYVLQASELRDIFGRVRRALRPGGVFIFDLSTPQAFRRHHGEVQVRRLPGLFLSLEDTWDDASGMGRMRLTGFARKGDLFRRIEEEHLRRGYTPDEVEHLLSQAGLAHERLAGYWESPDVKSVERLFYLARPA